MSGDDGVANGHVDLERPLSHMQACVAGQRMPVALRPGERWSLDFVSDTFGASRKFRMLAVSDDCCRENLCLMADISISGARVARELDALVRVYAKPACITSPSRDIAAQCPAWQWTTSRSSPVMRS